MNNISQLILSLLQKVDLSYTQMLFIMQHMMEGELSNTQIASLLTALAIKGEHIDEIFAAASIMRDLSTKLPIDNRHLLDTCGTGGDKSNLFNISTASAFVAAAAGAKVAKHGNRSFASQSGSADLLEAANINLDLSTEQVARSIEQIGIGFLFAPQYHVAMRHVAKVRKELGFQTIFNFLGPLSNPAGASYQLLGVNRLEMVMPMVQVLQKFGSKHAMVVCSHEGLDEISIATSSCIAELKNNTIHTYQICPKDFGIQTQAIDTICVSSPQESLQIIEAAFAGERGTALDILALNAGAAIYVADITDNLQDGIELAFTLLCNGEVQQKWQAYKDFSHRV